MNNTIHTLKQSFKTSCGRTPEYLEFHKLFKKEFTAYLKKLGALDIEIGKPNHFDVSGFFRVPVVIKESGYTTTQAVWFKIGDLRWSKENMLIRICRDYNDYVGGVNYYVNLSTKADFTAGVECFYNIVSNGYNFPDEKNLSKYGMLHEKMR